MDTSAFRDCMKSFSNCSMISLQNWPLYKISALEFQLIILAVKRTKGIRHNVVNTKKEIGNLMSNEK